MNKAAHFRLKPDGKLKLSENDVRRACLDLLRAHGWWPIRQHVGRVQTPNDGQWITIGAAGDPDYAVMKAPSFFLETKRPGGELSKVQRERIYQLELFYDLPTAVVESVDELIAWLERHARPR